MMKFKALCLSGVLSLLLMAPASADPIPTDILAELNILIDGSVNNVIDPQIYVLIGQNQEYSDEIAALLIASFDSDAQILADILGVVTDTTQQGLVRDSVAAAIIVKSNTGGTTGGGSGTSGTLTGSTENPNTDGASPITQ